MNKILLSLLQTLLQSCSLSPSLSISINYFVRFSVMLTFVFFSLLQIWFLLSIKSIKVYYSGPVIFCVEQTINSFLVDHFYNFYNFYNYLNISLWIFFPDLGIINLKLSLRNSRSKVLLSAQKPEYIKKWPSVKILKFQPNVA